ncbi:MAG: hypothetical protein ABI923_08200 [bacterium]
MPVSLILLLIYLCSPESMAQSEPERFEAVAQFSTLGIDDPHGLGKRTEVGVGGTFTFNFNRYFALEAAGIFFPRNYEKVNTNFTGGRVIEGLFGVKAGVRKQRLGFFGKARPGFVSSGRAVHAEFPNGNGLDPGNRFGFRFSRATQLALDVGGVLEIYPSKRAVVRFDAGDIITRYAKIQFTLFPQGSTGSETVYRNTLQFNAGVGFRF